jgi:hypothetical protein
VPSILFGAMRRRSTEVLLAIREVQGFSRDVAEQFIGNAKVRKVEHTVFGRPVIGVARLNRTVGSDSVVHERQAYVGN